MHASALASQDAHPDPGPDGFDSTYSRRTQQAMARRSDESANDALTFTARLPWWGGLVLAIAAYFVLHRFAMMDIAVAADAKDPGTMVLWTGLKAFARVGQYLFPVLLVVAAISSAVRGARKPVARKHASPPPRQDVRREPVFASINRGTAPSAARKPAGGGARRPDAWTLELLRTIDWKRFEAVCAEYFRLCGFQATMQRRGADGGIDIGLHAPNEPSKVANIVRCTQSGKPVGPKALRELLGVITAAKVPRGVFVSSSVFTYEAAQFAAQHPIHLLDGPGLLAKIEERPVADQQRLLAIATEGDYLTPTCPHCGVKMVQRQRRKDDSEFWACGSCKVTRSA